MADRLAMFKAAKAQRGSTSALTKEQIKALKAQKAKAAAEAEAAAKEAAEQQRKHEAAVAAATAAAAARRREQGIPPRPGTSGAMLPPAPRPRASNGSIGSAPAPTARRTDSQMTRVGRHASIAPEPAGQSNASSGAVHLRQEPGRPQSEERSISSLPEGFFDEPATSGGMQESVGTGELIGSNADVSSEVASALARGSSVEAMSARTSTSGLPADFFEAAGSNEGEAQAHPAAALTSEPAPQPAEADKPGELPKGFFENKDADAKARGVAPARKKTKEEEYADFMSAVAADVREVEAREQEEAIEAAKERAEREAFEQRVRLERIERLKRGATELYDAAEALQSEAVVPRVEPSVMPKLVKRQRVQVAQDSDSGEEPSDDEDAVLNWRAKGI